MLYVKRTPEINQTRSNFMPSEALPTIPEGWVQIPEALEETAIAYLPYLSLTWDSDGHIVDVGCVDHEEPILPPAEPDDITRLELALAELAEAIL